MSENLPGTLPGWNRALNVGVCEHCNSIYLLPVSMVSLDKTQAPLCPTCFRDQLDPMQEGLEQLPNTQPPELLVPFQIPPERVHVILGGFAQMGLFQPPDLKTEMLLRRLQRVYLPAWLVDAEVQAQWQAEAGYNYAVVSHQNEFENGRWHEREVTETKIRWEPRLGVLNRKYQNIVAPALDKVPEYGQYPDGAAQPYSSDTLAQTFVRLPDRSPKDAWNDALPTLKTAAQNECRDAARAQHIREFKWQADFHNSNWTQMLLPIYITYYQDDSSTPVPIIINGQTGGIYGVRRASMKRAQYATLIMGLLAVLAFLVGLGLDAASAEGLSRFAVFIGLICFVLAALPPIYVIMINAQARASELKG